MIPLEMRSRIEVSWTLYKVIRTSCLPNQRRGVAVKIWRFVYHVYDRVWHLQREFFDCHLMMAHVKAPGFDSIELIWLFPSFKSRWFCPTSLDMLKLINKYIYVYRYNAMLKSYHSYVGYRIKYQEKITRVQRELPFEFRLRNKSKILQSCGYDVLMCRKNQH